MSSINMDIVDRDKDSILAHSLLSVLDNLRPSMEITTKYLVEVSNIIEGALPVDMSLEFWCIGSNIVHKHLQLPQEQISYLLRLHAFVDNLNESKVNVLDLITSICIVSNGTWREKAKLLFRWYNMSGSGLLDEEEHFLLIRGVARCFKKLKFIGALDVTDKEAKYMAVKARVQVDQNGKGNFLPGLYYDDFVNWLETSEHCKIIFDFSAALFRLMDVLQALDCKSSNLLNTMNALSPTRNDDLPAACFDPNIKKTILDEIFVTSFSDTSVSLAFINERSLDKFQMYLKVDKLIFHESGLSDLPASIINRNFSLYKERINPDLCSFRTYHKESFIKLYRFPENDKNSAQFLRIDLNNLNPGTHYELTVFDMHHEFRKVRVRTLLNSPQVERHVSKVSSDDSAKEENNGELQKVCILPVDLCWREEFGDLIKVNESLRESTTFVFTGSICPAEKVCKAIHSFFYLTTIS